MTLGPGVMERVVDRTPGVSGAFLKELVRRAVQFHLECRPQVADDQPLEVELSANDFDEALAELQTGAVFTRGALSDRDAP
ncbi:MAG: hypothetical protein ACRCT8_15630 [Lacipirellulaceae bacterium]